MMQGAIRRTVRHRTEQRNDEHLPTVWIGGATGPSAWTDGAWLTRSSARLVGEADAPVLVLLANQGEDPLPELLAHAGAGARVYVLVGPGWGKNQADSQELQAKHVLIRRIPEVPASAVLVGREARLWIGGGFVLRLEAAQAEALRQNFLRLFWHEATEEAWSGGGAARVARCARAAFRCSRDPPVCIGALGATGCGTGEPRTRGAAASQCRAATRHQTAPALVPGGPGSPRSVGTAKSGRRRGDVD